MNALVRQLAALAILWVLCELLMPEGRQQQMVRMTVSVLVMTALLGTVGKWLGGTSKMPVWTQQTVQAGTESYRRIALTSMANQTAAYCELLAGKAGYEAEAMVWLDPDGALERVELTILQAQTPLISRTELIRTLAVQLQADADRFRLTDAEGT